eukprot:GHVU01184172.1.p1 GENE.GHVU01184172.1~~GHVU01184172.1.p1  ORF type:complete len:347 (-),score=38.03 GHVU01184172.1:1138-2178(-)
MCACIDLSETKLESKCKTMWIRLNVSAKAIGYQGFIDVEISGQHEQDTEVLKELWSADRSSFTAYWKDSGAAAFAIVNVHYHAIISHILFESRSYRPGYDEDTDPKWGLHDFSVTFEIRSGLDSLLTGSFYKLDTMQHSAWESDGRFPFTYEKGYKPTSPTDGRYCSMTLYQHQSGQKPAYDQIASGRPGIRWRSGGFDGRMNDFFFVDVNVLDEFNHIVTGFTTVAQLRGTAEFVARTPKNMTSCSTATIDFDNHLMDGETTTLFASARSPECVLEMTLLSVLPPHDDDGPAPRLPRVSVREARKGSKYDEEPMLTPDRCFIKEAAVHVNLASLDAHFNTDYCGR